MPRNFSPFCCCCCCCGSLVVVVDPIYIMHTQFNMYIHSLRSAGGSVASLIGGVFMRVM